MTVLAFLGSLAVTGMVATFIPVLPKGDTTVHADYHYVPDMGDAFGA